MSHSHQSNFEKYICIVWKGLEEVPQDQNTIMDPDYEKKKIDLKKDLNDHFSGRNIRYVFSYRHPVNLYIPILKMVLITIQVNMTMHS